MSIWHPSSTEARTGVCGQSQSQTCGRTGTLETPSGAIQLQGTPSPQLSTTSPSPEASCWCMQPQLLSQPGPSDTKQLIHPNQRSLFEV